LRLLERRSEPLDLLFTDVVMPGMTGSELAAAARLHQPNLKTLYTSGYTRNAIVHGGRLDAGVEMIAKPFTYPALAQKIRDVLDAGQTHRVLVVQPDATVRALASEALTGSGYAADEAANSVEAIGKLRAAQGRYDAVVIDVASPDRAGEALANEMRALYASIPLLLAVDPGERQVIDRFAAERCAEVMIRPYTTGRLIDLLRELGLACGSLPEASAGS
jgi:CheY-like chemotaxis protein